MGQKSAKQNLTQQFNFQQYGISEEEGANLKDQAKRYAKFIHSFCGKPQKLQIVIQIF
jgi:hypothetical protein